jgi:hypothetical protein
MRAINTSSQGPGRGTNRRQKARGKPNPEDLVRLHPLTRDNVSLERAWVKFNDSRNRPAPKATIETVMHAVRERGLAALKEPATGERLGRCDAVARAEINQRIEKLGLK